MNKRNLFSQQKESKERKREYQFANHFGIDENNSMKDFLVFQTHPDHQTSGSCIAR